MDILEAISRRVSVRNYQTEPASALEVEDVRRRGEEAEALTRAEMKFQLYSAEEIGRDVKGIIGDSWKFIRAPHYIVLVAIEGEGYLVDSGFRFEQMVLEATRMGLGTCWIGGMFKEASLRSALAIEESWRVIALTPIGRPADSSLVSRAFRAVARSSTRKPVEQIFFWQRHGGSLPAGVHSEERLARVLEATRRAPSWANKQPWRFILADREILVYKQMRQEREGKDYHLLDCGIAMAHLHLASRAVGMNGSWELRKCEVPGAPDAELVGGYVLDLSCLR
ncbi:MAG: nitroreductase family protein [Thermodesulfobacteriota bacterium]